MKIQTDKINIVEWWDAQAEAGWDENVKADLADCITVGFLISETKEAICVASTWAEPHSNCRIHIPKKWIKSRRELLIEEVQDGPRRIQADDQ